MLVLLENTTNIATIKYLNGEILQFDTSKIRKLIVDVTVFGDVKQEYNSANKSLLLQLTQETYAVTEKLIDYGLLKLPTSISAININLDTDTVVINDKQYLLITTQEYYYVSAFKVNSEEIYNELIQQYPETIIDIDITQSEKVLYCDQIRIQKGKQYTLQYKSLNYLDRELTTSFSQLTAIYAYKKTIENVLHIPVVKYPLETIPQLDEFLVLKIDSLLPKIPTVLISNNFRRSIITLSLQYITTDIDKYERYCNDWYVKRGLRAITTTGYSLATNDIVLPERKQLRLTTNYFSGEQLSNRANTVWLNIRYNEPVSKIDQAKQLGLGNNFCYMLSIPVDIEYIAERYEIPTTPAKTIEQFQLLLNFINKL